MSDARDPNNPPPKKGLYGQRPSISADTARRKEFERTWAMTPEERMLTALRLGEMLRNFVAEIRPLVAENKEP